MKHTDRVEYLVGSIHHVNGIPIDFDLETFNKALASVEAHPEGDPQESFLCAYLDSQYEVMSKFHPEIIGHLDLCRLYNPTLLFATYPRAQKLLERNINYAVQYGALFEVNSAAFRKGWDTAYPGEDVAKVDTLSPKLSLLTILSPVHTISRGSLYFVRRQPRTPPRWSELPPNQGVFGEHRNIGTVVSGPLGSAECCGTAG